MIYRRYVVVTGFCKCKIYKIEVEKTGEKDKRKYDENNRLNYTLRSIVKMLRHVIMTPVWYIYDSCNSNFNEMISINYFLFANNRDDVTWAPSLSLLTGIRLGTVSKFQKLFSKRLFFKQCLIYM